MRSFTLTHTFGWRSEHLNVFGVMGANTCACVTLQTAAIMEEHLVRHDAFSDEVGRLAMVSTHASFTSPHDKTIIGTGVCEEIRRKLETQRGGLVGGWWSREKL